MAINLRAIDAVILDLGGVILNIDYQRTIDAFRLLGYERFEEQYSKLQQSGLFDRLEKGLISESAFVEEILESLPGAQPQQVIYAWNALLLDFPEGRIETVRHIASAFPTYLLSNTNAIHYRAFTRTLKAQTGLDSLKPLFRKTYLSHEIHMRKPDPAVFRWIVEQEGLNPQKTLFVDDSPQHLRGAEEVGLLTYHMKDGDRLEDLFAPILA